MDAVKEDEDTLFAELFSHLTLVEQSPSTTFLNADLLKRAERALDIHTSSRNVRHLLATGESLLQILQQDPTPLTRLIEKDVLLIPFDELKSSISVEKLETGLTAPSVPVQLLCLAYLRKAASSPSGAAFVAASSSLSSVLVETWLANESTEVAERALEVIMELLLVDQVESITVVPGANGAGEAHGQGLLWRRLFHDQEVYSLFFDWTSMEKSRHDLKTKKGTQMATISQARLFDFVARVAELDWVPITTSAFPELEAQYESVGDVTERRYGGLLLYAGSNMIDETDPLMNVLRQDFFVKLLGTIGEGQSKPPPRLLEAIQEHVGVEESKERPGGLHL